MTLSLDARDRSSAALHHGREGAVPAPAPAVRVVCSRVRTRGGVYDRPMAAHDLRGARSLTSTADLQIPLVQSDTLSDVLEVVRLTGALFFLVEASSPWVAEAPAAEHLAPVIFPSAQHVVSYHLVRQGGCWCESPGQAPVRL